MRYIKRLVERMGRYDLFPQDIRQSLAVPTLDSLAAADVNEQEVNQWLGRLAFGIKTCELLLDAKASVINQVSLWAPGQLGGSHQHADGGLVVFHDDARLVEAAGRQAGLLGSILWR